MIVIKHISVLFVVISLSVVTAIVLMIPPENTITITNFEQINNTTYSVYFSDHSKETIILNNNYYNQETCVEFSNGNWACFYRQPGDTLYELYNMTRPQGYTIIGRYEHRNLFPKKQTPDISWKQIEYDEYPNLTNYYLMPEQYPQLDMSDPAIAEISALIRYFWKEDFDAGPDTMQCAEIRDIICSFAYDSPNITGIRIVNGRQYYPQFEDLISNKHAVAEIYTKRDGWILVDPMFGSFFYYNDHCIGVSDITRMNYLNYDEIQVIQIAYHALSTNDVFTNYRLNDDYFTYFNIISSIEVKSI